MRTTSPIGSQVRNAKMSAVISPCYQPASRYFVVNGAIGRTSAIRQIILCSLNDAGPDLKSKALVFNPDDRIVDVSTCSVNRDGAGRYHLTTVGDAGEAEPMPLRTASAD
ncbi:hypothetical protein QA633_08705 [Bradyrhizobium barranii]|uniref:hypothetical protein n=1 Tax=Bradyrhizobium barranii TaxID=2992140 RepID=UPI0024B276E9|nr:hypothetical protein [Bradyrhizobium barranii]WFT97097.1 hypothetical protein QA633_08705 [Bradyrhizobium barranii]